MAATDRKWARLELRGTGGEPSWLSEVGSWWRPAAALAAAAVAVLLWSDPHIRTEPAHTAAEMALGLVASDGDPVALWAALGVSADPVLALLTFEDHRAWGAASNPAPPSTGVTP
ncbi:MAG: hypothetical protein WEB90_03090 [Gemmatimonadota bacterium]